MTTQTIETSPSKSVAPALAALVTHRVRDYAAWKVVFDEHEAARRAAGIVGHHINRSADDPNLLSVYLAATDPAKLQAFFQSEDLKATMGRAGVEGPPTITVMKPVEDLTAKRDPLPGVIVIHNVRDYAAWKPVFDEHGTTRAKAGIIGHAVNRTADDPNKVIVYLQAETREALENFAESADLKATMQRAGVVGPPTLRFVEGAGWATY